MALKNSKKKKKIIAMNLNKNLLIIVLILFCNTSMYPQDTNRESNQDQMELELHNIISKYEMLIYEVEWEKAYATLIEAALKTNLVLEDPCPYVLQTSLEDFYVSYEINIYTNHSNKRNRILSELHENIQDLCYENGIEILSPHYKSLKDGLRVAIPEIYIPENYQPSYFTV